MSVFESIDNEKRYRVLNAALQEFANHSYEQASTNRIVKQAGIGKGMLFHYFNSKEDLFHYLINHAIEFINEHYVVQLKLDERDFIERMKLAAELKLKIYRAHPELFNFIAMVYVNEPERLTEIEMRKLHDMQKNGFTQLYNGIDTSLFRDDIPTEQALKLIQWSIDGYQQEMIGILKGKKLDQEDFNPYWKEFSVYMQALKTAFYK